MAVAMVAAAVAGGQPDKYPCSLGAYLYPYSISDPHIRIRPVPFGGHIRNIRMVSDINGYPPAENQCSGMHFSVKSTAIKTH